MEDYIKEMKEKLDVVWETASVEDLKRIHSKFVGAVISVEVAFKKKFPEEWEVYQKEFYGED